MTLKTQHDAGQTLSSLKSTVATVQGDIVALKTDVSGMKGEVAKISTLELNIEAFRVEQRQANEELLGHIIRSYDDQANEQHTLENRVDRIEKHLNLPPVKQQAFFFHPFPIASVRRIPPRPRLSKCWASPCSLKVRCAWVQSRLRRF